MSTFQICLVFPKTAEYSSAQTKKNRVSNDENSLKTEKQWDSAYIYQFLDWKTIKIGLTSDQKLLKTGWPYQQAVMTLHFSHPCSEIDEKYIGGESLNVPYRYP